MIYNFIILTVRLLVVIKNLKKKTVSEFAVLSCLE